jgi:hypothetical protein
VKHVRVVCPSSPPADAMIVARLDGERPPLLGFGSEGMHASVECVVWRAPSPPHSRSEWLSGAGRRGVQAAPCCEIVKVE